MRDMWKIRGKMEIPDHSCGPWRDGVRKYVTNADGTVGVQCFCGHWDFESDRFGYCRDEECRRDRFIAALYKGEAMMLRDGTIIWTPGVVIRKG